MFTEQNGRCLICGEPMEYGKRSARTVCVDHCHTTKKVRGLLCMQHNLMLGYAADNPVILERAIQYLKENHERQLSGRE